MFRTVRSTPTLAFITLFLIVAPTPSESFAYSQYRTLFSLAHSLMSRVANLRAARGDIAGSARARAIAKKLERGLGLGFWGLMWSAGWDYARNYAWRDLAYTELYGGVSDMNELLRCLAELTRMESDAERSAWMGRNYQNVLRAFNSLSRKLLKVFRQSGVVSEVVETVQVEVVEGRLLRDCLELGGNDLKGLIQIMKNLILQFSSGSDIDTDTDL